MNIPKYADLYRKDLELKAYSQNSIDNYVSQVNCFLNHFDKLVSEPSKITETQIKEWLLLANSINGRKHRISALKLFYRLTIKQPLKFKHIEYPKLEKKLPRIIDKDFLVRRIKEIENLKHKSIIALAYSTGMRVSEVCNLKIKDIDSARMIIHITNAKGRKDRIVPLSEYVLGILREYFKAYKPKEYLFNGQFDLQYSPRSCNQIVKKYLGEATHFHLLRHSSFTALLEQGTDMRIIQKLAGHSSSKTTEIYTHVSRNLISSVCTPI
jgi:site-specific recombinase XerD